MPKIKIKNLSAEINRRIKLIKTATSVVDIGQQQGAVVNQSDYVGICLAPAQNIPIGCAGANPTADTGGIWGSPLMLVNGIGYDGIRSIPDILEFDNQGSETHWKFRNISDEFLKVQINTGPENLWSEDIGWAENTNPTLEVNFETGQVNFCLSPKEAVYPPYAVIKTSAPWGSSFPAKITVDGIEHEGDLFGDLADILAHQYNIYTGFERIWTDSEDAPDLVRIVFAGDVFVENTAMKVDFLTDISIDYDDSLSYPENETLQLNAKSASFNIGKLVCDMGVKQEAWVEMGDIVLQYGQNFSYRVGDRINANVLASRIAGEGIEDPTDHCSTAISPEGCVQHELLVNLMEQWNPDLATIGVKADWSNQIKTLKPINAIDGNGNGNDPNATAKLIIQPSDQLSIQDMVFLGYAIPTCVEPS